MAGIRSTVQRAGGVALAVIGAAALSLAPTLSVPASAVTALVMGGTDQPRPAELGDYMPDVRRQFLDPETSCKVLDCRLEPVDYPAEFWPFPQWGGLEAMKYDRSVAVGVTNLEAALLAQRSAHPDETIVVFGASQSATVVTTVKRNLAAAAPEVREQLAIVLIGNPNRPNGGLLARLSPWSVPVLEFTGNGGTPTDTGIATTDIAFQYDIAADFPRYPLNLFALLNSIIGIDIHGDYLNNRNGYSEAELLAAMQDPANRQTYGDTTYITIPVRDLPLVQPLRRLGVDLGATAITEPLVALIEPTLRVLVELGYDRSTEYGHPTPFGLFPRIDPLRLGADLVAAVDTGLRDAYAEVVASQQPPALPAPTTVRADQTSAAVEPVKTRSGSYAFDRPDRRAGSPEPEAEAGDTETPDTDTGDTEIEDSDTQDTDEAEPAQEPENVDHPADGQDTATASNDTASDDTAGSTAGSTAGTA